MTTPAQLADRYLHLLGTADLEGMLELFATDGVVNSPLYGTMPAGDFFPALFADSAESVLTLLGVTDGRAVGGAQIVTIWFHFDWRLKDGTPVPFDVVDVMELDESGQVTALTIVYDTAGLRADFERVTAADL